MRPARKQEAADQFEKAEQMREALNGRPAEERTRRDYQRVADAYRKVYYVAPASSKADASVIAVAEILATMGRQFEPGEKDLRSAIREYEFLRHEYPGSKYRFQALFTIGQIYAEDLGDDEAARKTFEEFLQRYPRQPLAREAKQALAELNQPKSSKKPVEEARTEPPETSAKGNRFANHCCEEVGVAHGDRHPPLVYSGLHPGGDRCRPRSEVRSGTRSRPGPHLLRSAGHQACVSPGRQELRCA